MKPATDDALDQELMAAVARRDASAFARLMECRLGWASRFVERMVGSRADAQDLVQTAFLCVWQGDSRWTPSAKFSTWFHRVLYNLCMDRFRSRGTPTETLDDDYADDGPTAEERMETVQRADRVRAALAALPERQRAAIVLCHYEERSQAEAAALLGVSEGALESLLSRGRAELGKHMSSDLHRAKFGWRAATQAGRDLSYCKNSLE